MCRFLSQCQKFNILPMVTWKMSMEPIHCVNVNVTIYIMFNRGVSVDMQCEQDYTL